MPSGFWLEAGIVLENDLTAMVVRGRSVRGAGDGREMALQIDRRELPMTACRNGCMKIVFDMLRRAMAA